MIIIRKQISVKTLKQMATKSYGNLVKAVVDVEKEIIAVDADLHADQEALLLENGSKQENLWGINIYPDKTRDKWIEYDSMINLRPGSGNNSRSVENQKLKEKIKTVINKLVK